MTINPISHPSTNRRALALAKPLLRPGARVLDLGAGEGFFSKLLGEYAAAKLGVEPAAMISACDVTPEIFRYSELRCERIEPGGRLPYDRASFDLVCSLEVVEHVEDHFAFCREIVRVLKPGGVALISTPNVLNLTSRVRNLHSGFPALFNPLSWTSSDVVHMSGHIHPVSYYYLAFAFYRAGAKQVTAEFDRHKRSAMGMLVLLWPLLVLGNAGFRIRVSRKNPEVAAQNAELLAAMRSVKMLTARSVIVRVLT